MRDFRRHPRSYHTQNEAASVVGEYAITELQIYGNHVSPQH